MSPSGAGTGQDRALFQREGRAVVAADLSPGPASFQSLTLRRGAPRLRRARSFQTKKQR
jgi:hypothetical protein